MHIKSVATIKGNTYTRHQRYAYKEKSNMIR